MDGACTVRQAGMQVEGNAQAKAQRLEPVPLDWANQVWGASRE